MKTTENKEPKKVFLAETGCGFTSLVNVVPVEPAYDGPLDFDAVNRLMGWRDLDDLVSVLEECGPLVASNIFYGSNRVITIGDAVEMVEFTWQRQGSMFGPVLSNSMLPRQLYLDGAPGTYPSEDSVRRSISRHGIIESNAADALRSWEKDDSDVMVVVEPIADLAFARNLCSIAVRVIAACQSGERDVLDKAGFVHVERRNCWWNNLDSCGGYYIAPLHSGFPDEEIIKPAWRHSFGTMPHMAVDPLHTLFGMRRYGRTWNHAHAELPMPMYPNAMQPQRPYETMSLYLGNGDTRSCIALSGDRPQWQLAYDFIDSLYKTIHILTDDFGESFGLDFYPAPSIRENSSPAPRCHSLFAAMLGAVIFRNGVEPCVCGKCGRSFLRPQEVHPGDGSCPDCSGRDFSAERRRKGRHGSR